MPYSWHACAEVLKEEATTNSPYATMSARRSRDRNSRDVHNRYYSASHVFSLKRIAVLGGLGICLFYAYQGVQHYFQKSDDVQEQEQHTQHQVPSESLYRVIHQGDRYYLQTPYQVLPILPNNQVGDLDHRIRGLLEEDSQTLAHHINKALRK